MLEMDVPDIDPVVDRPRVLSEAPPLIIVLNLMEIKFLISPARWRHEVTQAWPAGEEPSEARRLSASGPSATAARHASAPS